VISGSTAKVAKVLIRSKQQNFVTWISMDAARQKGPKCRSKI
jgi:hypothetical protein